MLSGRYRSSSIVMEGEEIGGPIQEEEKSDVVALTGDIVEEKVVANVEEPLNGENGESGGGTGGEVGEVDHHVGDGEGDGGVDKHAPAILGRIDKEILGQVKEMGFPNIRAEKAVFLTQNHGIEAAIKWLEDHQDDEDIDEPLIIVDGPGDDAAPGESSRPKLTQEEAAAKAYELQKRIREKRAEKEKKDELEREKNRMLSTKLALEQARKLEEAERKRHIESLQREKKEHQAEKERQREMIKREWEERFGRPYVEPKAAVADVSSMSGKEQIKHYLQRLRKNYQSENLDGFKTCLSTLAIYCQNASQNPTEAKYHRIKKSNQGFQTRVAPFEGAIGLLNAVGFIEDDTGEFLAIKGVPDGFLLGEALRFIKLLQG